MYMTTMVMSPEARHAMQFNFHGWYGIILNLFPNNIHGKTRNVNESVLFRVENGRVLVQSTIEPNTINFKHNTILSVNTKKVETEMPDIVNVQVVMTAYRRRGKQERFVYSRAEKLDLFHERIAVPTHSKVLDIEPGETFQVTSKKYLDNRVENIIIPVANWMATLQLQDKDAFLKLRQQGVGRGRSSGCGLVLTA